MLAPARADGTALQRVDLGIPSPGMRMIEFGGSRFGPSSECSCLKQRRFVMAFQGAAYASKRWLFGVVPNPEG
jgi:hypothetical protein